MMPGSAAPLLSPGIESHDATGFNRVYTRRWLMISVLAILNVANGMLWISYSPISDHTAKYYEADDWKVNWLSLVFPVATVILALPVAWLNDIIGLRATLITAGWLNCVAGGLRVCSSLSVLPQGYHYPLVLAGQTVASVAQPLCLFTSTKLAAVWFPESERVMANTIGSMANPLGILIANMLSPVIVKSAKDMYILNWSYFGPSAFGAVIASVGVWSSVPPTPPSETASGSEVPQGEFFSHLGKALRNWRFLVLMLVFGGGTAAFTSLSTLIEQILCRMDYSDLFAGLCGALLIGVGLVGAIIVGVIVDKTKRFLEVIKVCYALTSLGLIAFAILSNMPDMEILIAFACAWIGGFGFPLYPTSLELGVECTYPVGETVSTGLLMLSGQLQSIAFIFAMQMSASNLDDKQCPLDYKYSVYALAVFSVTCVLITMAFLWTEYRRLRMELHGREENMRVQIAASITSDTIG